MVHIAQEKKKQQSPYTTWLQNIVTVIIYVVLHAEDMKSEHNIGYLNAECVSYSLIVFKEKKFKETNKKHGYNQYTIKYNKLDFYKL